MADNNIHYGSFYVDDANPAISITVSATGTYYEVGSGMLDGGCSPAFTFQNGKELLCNRSGIYLANWSMTLTCGVALQEVGGAVMVNTDAKDNTEGMAEIVNAGKDVCVSGSGIIQLAVGNTVKLCVENESGTNNISLTHANLTLIKVRNV